MLLATPAADTYVSSWGLPGCLYSTLTCSLTLTADTSVVLQLAPKPTLSIGITGNGTAQAVWSPPGALATQTAVKCAASCSIPIDPGVLVEIDAIAGSGSALIGFTGDCTSTLSPCYLYVDASKAIAIAFAGKPMLSVTVTGSGHGTVTSSDGQLSCPTVCTDAVTAGSSLTLTAAPDTSSSFGGWSGACSGTQPTCTLSVTGATAARASFNAKPSSSGGGGSGGGGGGLDPATLALLAALVLERVRTARRRAH
jgi:hypothetical protein